MLFIAFLLSKRENIFQLFLVSAATYAYDIKEVKNFIVNKDTLEDTKSSD